MQFHTQKKNGISFFMNISRQNRQEKCPLRDIVFPGKKCYNTPIDTNSKQKGKRP